MSDNDKGNPDKNEEDKKQVLSFWQVVSSTIASFFGVQSQKNRERDFKYGNPVAFLVAGLILTLLFIASIITVVILVTNDTGI